MVRYGCRHGDGPNGTSTATHTLGTLARHGTLHYGHKVNISSVKLHLPRSYSWRMGCCYLVRFDERNAEMVDAAVFVDDARKLEEIALGSQHFCKSASEWKVCYLVVLPIKSAVRKDLTRFRLLKHLNLLKRTHLFWQSLLNTSFSIDWSSFWMASYTRISTSSYKALKSHVCIDAQSRRFETHFPRDAEAMLLGFIARRVFLDNLGI